MSESKRRFDIRHIYLKDASFESPHAPAIFTELNTQPNIDVQVKVKHRSINDAKTAFEVVLFAQVTGKAEDKTIFLAEIQQAGTFHIEGFGENEILPMLEIVAPTNLLPYAREAISNLTGRGGLPPVLISPVNFEALFMAKHKKEAEAAQNSVEDKSQNTSEKT